MLQSAAIDPHHTRRIQSSKSFYGTLPLPSRASITMLGSSASLTADDVCIKCRVRRSPYALNPEYDEEIEMQCTLRSWKRDMNNSSGSLFSSGNTSRPNSRQPSPAGSRVGSPVAISQGGGGGGGGGEKSEITGAGIAAAWLQQQQHNGQGGEEKGGLASHDSSPTLNKLLGQDNGAHHHGPEILFKAVHSNVGMMPRQKSSGQSRTFSHIRSRSVGRATTPMKGRSRLPSPLIRRPPVSAIDKKNLVAADGDATGSNPGSRSSSRQRPGSSGRSQSRGRRASALAAAAVFDSQGLNDSGGGDYSIGASPGDSPYNSDGEGCAIAALPSYRIPTSDVIVADIATEQYETSPDGGGGGGGITHRVYLTTVSSGYFEITFDSANSHSVMVAFLHAALPPERIHRKLAPDNDTSERGKQAIFSTASCCADAVTRESFDMDNFMAKELNETMQREGMFDKLKRRIAHIAGQCGDLSAQISDTVCGGPAEVATDSGHHTVDYSMGAFDSTITTPVQHNRKHANSNEHPALPDEPRISFEATPSRDSESYVADIQIKDELIISSDHLTRPTANLKESSTEQGLFTNNANNGPSTPIGTSGSDGASVTEDHTGHHRPPDDTGGAEAMMQSVDI